jgi:repressor LexA
MKPLSTMQQKVLNRLSDYKRKTGELPDLSEFARDLGMHYVSLKQHLEALAKKGYLTFTSRGRGRSPIIDLPTGLTGIPLLGHIPAGSLSEAFSHAESFLPLTGFHEDYFALRVQGDSMADLIQSGDAVLLRRGLPERPGEICAVRAFDSETTLKYVDWTSPKIYTLRPHNPQYPTVNVAASDLQIDGGYKGLVRGEILWALLEED